MRIVQDWLTSEKTQYVCAALTQQGAQVFFVGGCVRNALLDAPVSDIDIATDATPSDVIASAKQAGIKAVPTGIDYGTITLVYKGTPFEVTTFRKDVSTDGRRAVVAFSRDIKGDAARRDFTMNALYARPDGELVDPLGGYADLESRCFRFIGDADARIREDYLRVLRYFRFHAWYGDQDVGFDPDALAAITNNLEGLAQISRERVGAELIKLLLAKDPTRSIATMRQIGVLYRILPGSDDRALGPLVHFDANFSPDPSLRLAALGEDTPGKTLRLSKAITARSRLFRELAVGTMTAAEMSYRHGVDIARGSVFLRAALLETPLSSSFENEIARGAKADFPISAQDLMPDLSGAALGEALKSLESQWIKSGFSLSRETLLGAAN